MAAWCQEHTGRWARRGVFGWSWNASRRLAAVHLALFAGAASAQAPNLAPLELVRQTMAREVTAANAGGHLMYRRVTATQRGSETHAIVETRDWSVGRLIGINGLPLPDGQTRSEVERLRALRADTARVAALQQSLHHDEQRVRRIMQALPDAFEYEQTATEAGDDGRPLARLAFRPRRGYDPPSRELAVLTGMEGTMLIDVAARRLVRLEATLVRGVSFGWGILGRLDRGGRVLLQQRRVAGERWAITTLQYHFEGKVLLVKPVAFDAFTRASDFTPMADDLTLEEGIARLLTEPATASAHALACRRRRSLAAIVPVDSIVECPPEPERVMNAA